MLRSLVRPLPDTTLLRNHRLTITLLKLIPGSLPPKSRRPDWSWRSSSEKETGRGRRRNLPHYRHGVTTTINLAHADLAKRFGEHLTQGIG